MKDENGTVKMIEILGEAICVLQTRNAVSGLLLKVSQSETCSQ